MVTLSTAEPTQHVETSFDPERIAKEIAKECKEWCKDVIKTLEQTDRVAKVAFKVHFKVNSSGPSGDSLSIEKSFSVVVEQKFENNELPKGLKTISYLTLKQQFPGRLDDEMTFDYSFTVSLYGSNGSILKERTWKEQKQAV